MKLCKNCGSTQRRKTGCIVCQRASCRRYYWEHKEAIQKRRKLYHLKNREHLIKKAAEWREANPEKAREHKRRWNEKNKIAYLKRERARYRAQRFQRLLYAAFKYLFDKEGK